MGAGGRQSEIGAAFDSVKARRKGNRAIVKHRRRRVRDRISLRQFANGLPGGGGTGSGAATVHQAGWVQQAPGMETGLGLVAAELDEAVETDRNLQA